MCCGQKGGYTRRRRRGEEEGERGQCTWSQPPSFPSPLPGSPRLHRTPWLPSPPHPCAQPLQKQPPLALRTPRLSPLEVVRMLLARLARLPLYPLKLLPAAMTAPRTAGRGVRVRERRRRQQRSGVGARGRPRGSGGGGAGRRLAGRTADEGGDPSERAAQVAPGVAVARQGKVFPFLEPAVPLPPTPRPGKVLWQVMSWCF